MSAPPFLFRSGTMSGWTGLELVGDRLREWLRASGVSDSRTLAHLFTEDEISDGSAPAEFLAPIVSTRTGDTIGLLREFRDVLRSARLYEDMMNTSYSVKKNWVVSALGDKRRRLAEWQAEEDRYHRAGIVAVRAKPPPPPEATRIGAATRRMRMHDGDPQGRALAEQDERARWMKALAGLIRDSGASLLNQSWDGLSIEALVEMLVGGRRASTLRARARAWRRYQGYLHLAYGVRHPRGIADYLDYLRVRALEPCSQSVLRGLRALYAFMGQMTGAVPGVVEDPLMKAAFKEYLSQAPARRAGDARPAARFPAQLLMAMETMITEGKEATYDRLICWWTLLTCWATMRFDDHRGLIPSEIRDTGDGWNFDLRRTKTTGPGKQVSIRPCHLASGAYFLSREWFPVGLRLWETAAPFERDFMLCVPAAGSGEAMHREISHDEFTARLRGLVARLEVNGVRMDESVARWFTPHSGRNFLPSAALPLLRSTEEDIRKLGAWSARGGEAYVRTAREHTRYMQREVAEKLRSSMDEVDPLGEREGLENLRAHLINTGSDRNRADEMIDALAWKRKVGTRMPTETDEGGAGASSSSSGLEPSGESGASSSNAVLPGGGSEDSKMVQAAPDTETVSGYVCSVIGRRQVRRLHFVGLCYRRPGWDYRDYVAYGEELPGPSSYDLVCRQCWPDGRPGQEGESSMASTDESSSSDYVE